MSDRPGLSIIVVPDGTEDSRTYRLSHRKLRLLRISAVAAAIVVLFLASTWTLMARRTLRMADLQAQVTELEAEQSRVPVLVAQLEDLEQQYEQIRAMFAPSDTASPGDLWLPPAGGRRQTTREPAEEEAVPNSWPLSERGFVTRGRFEGESGGHPGLDIAVPTDSYVRAAGSGIVLEAGEDDTYGLFVRIDHGNGYVTLYAHASATLVGVGEAVRKNEVIALSGSTGQSTAPHLHFEVLLDGQSVDPLELVTQP